MKITMQCDLGDRPGELAQRLAHETGLEAGQAVTHVAFEFSARRQGRDRVDDEHVDGAGSHQRIGDLQGLLAGVRLGNQKLVNIDTQLAGVDRIDRMLGVDETADAAGFLGLGNNVEREGRLAG